MLGLQGKRVVVASGATGIGAAIARRLGAEGACLIVGDINESGVRGTVERIKGAGGTAEATRFDLADQASIEALMALCVDRHGGQTVWRSSGPTSRPRARKEARIWSPWTRQIGDARLKSISRAMAAPCVPLSRT
jgi:NAD(P)-dependent dehydrogenase (short-subunit alcohol dehydrogenase family)